MSGGSLTVDGARAGTDADFGPGHVLEFVATFRADSFQHGGFVRDFEFATPFAMFSTRQSTDTLFARTSHEGAATDTELPGAWLGAPHRYRVEWTPTAVMYFIDGSQVATHAIAIAGPMRPLFSDANTNTVGLSVDWLRMTPYATRCAFESRIFDAGVPVTWEQASWTSDTPAGTSLTISVRTGDTASPDASWSGFRLLDDRARQSAPARATSRTRRAAGDGGPRHHA